MGKEIDMPTKYDLKKDELHSDIDSYKNFYNKRVINILRKFATASVDDIKRIEAHENSSYSELLKISKQKSQSRAQKDSSIIQKTEKLARLSYIKEVIDKNIEALSAFRNNLSFQNSNEKLEFFAKAVHAQYNILDSLNDSDNNGRKLFKKSRDAAWDLWDETIYSAKEKDHRVKL